VREPTSRRRLGVTLGVAFAALLVFAVIGGSGLAGGLAKPAKSQYGPGQYQYGHKVTICHKGKVTIRVAIVAWLRAHQKHGDTLGPCATTGAAAAKAAKLKAAKLKAAKLKAAKLKAAKAKAAKAKKAAASASTVTIGVSISAGKKAAKAKTGKAEKSAKTVKAEKPAKAAAPAPTTGETAAAPSVEQKAAKPKKNGKAAGSAPSATEPVVTVEPGNGNGKANGGVGNGNGKGNGKH
jgi:hypothetical protein